VDDSAFFTQGRLSVGTVVPDGPFFWNAEGSVPYNVFNFPFAKGRLPFGLLFTAVYTFRQKGKTKRRKQRFRLYRI